MLSKIELAAFQGLKSAIRIVDFGEGFWAICEKSVSCLRISSLYYPQRICRQKIF